jgi:hypothetical protein
LLIVIDETLERRLGAKIRAKGVFRDAVRSTKERVVTSFGLRWIAMMLVVKVPWAQRAADPDAVWQTLNLTWYGGEPRTVLTQTGTALWYTPRFAPASIRWVLVRCPDGRFDDPAFLCTDLDATPAQVLAWVVLRWNIEVTFEDVRQHLGVETQRQWSDKAIARNTPSCWACIR